MKKIIMLIVTVFSLAMAGSAFAGATVNCALATAGLSLYGAKTGTAAATDTLIGKTSTGVSVGAKTGVQGYALNSQHKSGAKAFGASHDSTSIYAATAVVGTIFLIVPTTSDKTSFEGQTGWDSM